MNIRFGNTARRKFGRLLFRAGLPIAVVMAAAVGARAYDTTWISNGAPISSSKLKADLDEAQTRIAALEAAVAALQATDCPPGYTKDGTVTSYIVCKKGVDEMVKVGTGRSAFWIDRYEASLWTNPDGTGTQYGIASGDTGTFFPPSGQYGTPLYAVSAANVMPSGYVSWFQANEACRLSGKRLPTADEWLAAARNTVETNCNFGGASGALRKTGLGTGCVSSWGAQDMAGNLYEWTTEWYTSVGAASGVAGGATWPFGNSDRTLNANSYTLWDGGVAAVGLPAAAERGGYYVDTPDVGGIFELNLLNPPSNNKSNLTATRCVMN